MNEVMNFKFRFSIYLLFFGIFEDIFIFILETTNPANIPIYMCGIWKGIEERYNVSFTFRTPGIFLV